MPDCSRQAQKVDEIKAEIADLQPGNDEPGAGPFHHPPAALNALQRALTKAEIALSACLNQPVISTLFPRYLVTNILYNPPGNGSDTTYGAGSSTGVTVQTTNSFRLGASLATTGKFLGNGLDASVQFNVGPKDGKSCEIKKERSSTLSLTSKTDAIDHAQDLFLIWTNIRVDAAQSPDQSVSLSVGVRGAGLKMDIVSLTGAELLDQRLIPEFKKPHLKALTPADYATIAALNPLLISGALDPGRYRLVQNIAANGPDNPGDSIPGRGIEISGEIVTGTISGTVTQLNVAVTFDTGFSIGVASSSLSVGLTFEWDYETSRNVTAGVKEAAGVLLRSETVGYHKSVDVYQDTMFNTFAFVESPETPDEPLSALTGTVTDVASNPVFNSRVDVILSDGVRHTTFTNAQGVYRLFVPAQGQAKISVADIVKTVELTGAPITVAFQPGAE